VRKSESVRRRQRGFHPKGGRSHRPSRREKALKGGSGSIGEKKGKKKEGLVAEGGKGARRSPCEKEISPDKEKKVVGLRGFKDEKKEGGGHPYSLEKKKDTVWGKEEINGRPISRSPEKRGRAREEEKKGGASARDQP